MQRTSQLSCGGSTCLKGNDAGVKDSDWPGDRNLYLPPCSSQAVWLLPHIFPFNISSTPPPPAFRHSLGMESHKEATIAYLKAILHKGNFSLKQMETTTENLNQSKYTELCSPLSVDTSTKHPHLKLKEHCRRRGKNIVRARGSGSLLWDCVA